MPRAPRPTAITTFGVTFEELNAIVRMLHLPCAIGRDYDGVGFIEFTPRDLIELEEIKSKLSARFRSVQTHTPGTMIPAMMQIVQLVINKIKGLRGSPQLFRCVRIKERTR